MNDFIPAIWTNKIVAHLNASSEMLGMFQPTPEEQAASRARRVEAWRVYDHARGLLTAITSPAFALIVALHWPNDVERPVCAGCDIDGYEAEEPEWPCRTIRVVAAAEGIALPETHLDSRPEVDQ